MAGTKGSAGVGGVDPETSLTEFAGAASEDVVIRSVEIRVVCLIDSCSSWAWMSRSAGVDVRQFGTHDVTILVELFFDSDQVSLIEVEGGSASNRAERLDLSGALGL